MIVRTAQRIVSLAAVFSIVTRCVTILKTAARETTQRKVRRKIQLGGGGRECVWERGGEETHLSPSSFLPLSFPLCSSIRRHPPLSEQVEQASARIQNINRRAQSTSCGYKSFFIVFSLWKKRDSGKAHFLAEKGAYSLSRKKGIWEKKMKYSLADPPFHYSVTGKKGSSKKKMKYILADPPFQYSVSGEKGSWKKKMKYFLSDPPFQYWVSGKKESWKKKMKYFLAYPPFQYSVSGKKGIWE